MSTSKPALDLSVIIPAYNEAKRIVGTLEEVDDFLDNSSLGYEIVVVDDGSVDDTVETVAAVAANRAAIRVIATRPNRGKGAAVRTGMLAARGAVRLMCDADGSMPATEIPKLYNPVATGQVALAIGSRYADGAEIKAPSGRAGEAERSRATKKAPSGRAGEARRSRAMNAQPRWRQAWSRLCNWFIQRTVVAGVADTQCGFKAFSAEAAEATFSRATVDGWAFDLEILALADRMSFAIREVPVVWSDDENSRVNPVRDFIGVVREWMTIRRNLRRDVYGLLPSAASSLS